MGKGAKMKASSKKDYRHEDNVSEELEEEAEDVNIVVEEEGDLEEKKESSFDVSEAVEKISEKRATIREKYGSLLNQQCTSDDLICCEP